MSIGEIWTFWLIKELAPVAIGLGLTIVIVIGIFVYSVIATLLEKPRSKI